MKNIKVVCPYCGHDDFFYGEPFNNLYWPESYCVNWDCLCEHCGQSFIVKERYQIVEAASYPEEE